VKSKILNIFIIISALIILAVSPMSKTNVLNGLTVYAEDSDANETTEGQVGDYGYKVIQHYDDEWPSDVPIELRYEKFADYPAFPHYIVNIDGNRQRVYQGPSKDAVGIDRLYYGERCKVLELIENDIGEHWYIIVTKIEGEDFIGFIPTDKVAKRELRLSDMNQQVQTLTGIGSLGPVVHIENYKSLNGIAPELPSGEYYDIYGNRRGQAAAGYLDKSLQGEFRYIPDGTICIVEEIVDITDIESNNLVFNSMGEYVPATGSNHTPESIKSALDEYNMNAEPFISKVYVPSFGISLWIDSVYIDMNKQMQGGFGQTIVVDRKNQNIAVFEYDNGWKVISMSFATTGKNTETAVPTPLGFFMAIEKKDKFEYQEEGSRKIEGFAPYAIRFSGGGYLHGVPMKYEYDSKGNIKPVYTFTESILSIGTVPESHMCVRNFTSHAQFVYDWAAIGSCSVIVFE